MALYSSSTHVLAVWVRPHQTHGEPKTGDPRLGGRPTAENRIEYEDILPIANPVPPDGDSSAGRPASAEDVKKLCKSLLANKLHWRVKCHVRVDCDDDVSLDLACTGHENEDGKACPWRGVCTYARNTRTGLIRGMPAEVHYKVQRATSETFTEEQRDLLRRLPRGSTRGQAHMKLTHAALKKRSKV